MPERNLGPDEVMQALLDRQRRQETPADRLLRLQQEEAARTRTAALRRTADAAAELAARRRRRAMRAVEGGEDA